MVLDPLFLYSVPPDNQLHVHSTANIDDSPISWDLTNRSKPNSLSYLIMLEGECRRAKLIHRAFETVRLLCVASRASMGYE